MILEVFSNLNDSVILRFYDLQAQRTCGVRTRSVRSFGARELAAGSSPAVGHAEARAADERSALFAAFLPFRGGAGLERELF